MSFSWPRDITCYLTCKGDVGGGGSGKRGGSPADPAEVLYVLYLNGYIPQKLKRPKDHSYRNCNKPDLNFIYFQTELEQVVHEWNIHKISKTRNSISPTGRPALMYEVPSLYGAKSYLVPVPTFAIEELSSNCTFLNYPCNDDFL